MSFVDFPLPRNNRPPFGAFVVVALDPVASLAGIKDPSVEEAARRLKTQKRLVMVDLALGAPPGTTYLHFNPVGSGLPNEAWACVPVSPQSSNPEGRCPISVSGPLPIRNAYIHTTEAFEGIVSRIYTDRPIEIQCSDADRTRVYKQHLEDVARVEAAEWDSLHGNVEPSAPSLNDEEEIIFSPFPILTQPCYRMWLEVSADETFADPRTHREEIDALLAIEAEWRERRELECTTREDRLLQWRESHGEYEDWEDDEKNTPQSSRKSSPQPPVSATHDCEQDGTPLYPGGEEQSELSFAHLSYVSIGLRDRDGSASETTCSEPPSVRSGKNDDDVSSASAPHVTAYPATGPSNDGRPQDSNRIADEDDWVLAYSRVKAFIGDCVRAIMPAEAW